jgi:hypothetical protein
MACLERDPELVHVPAGGIDLRSRLTSVRKLETSTPAAARGASPFSATPHDAHTLAELVMTVLRPASITATGPAARFWLEPFRSLPSIATAPDRDRYDVVLAMGALASVRVDEEADVIDRLVQVGDTIVLELPTPGLERMADRSHRPIGYWAARFLDRGFVLSDELRAAIEDRWDTARDSYSFALLYVARRLSTESRLALQSAPELRSAILGQATRVEELSIQSARLRLECQAGGARSSGFTVPSIDIDAIPEDIEPAGGHCFVWRFERPALRLCQRAGLLRQATMHEDDATLPLSHTLAADVQERGRGRYIVRTDAIYFSSSDNSDPRTNGRRYAMRVPADVARLAGLA